MMMMNREFYFQFVVYYYYYRHKRPDYRNVHPNLLVVLLLNWNIVEMFAQLAWNHVENNKLRKINFNFEKKTFTHTHTKHWREKNVRKSEQKKKSLFFPKHLESIQFNVIFLGKWKWEREQKTENLNFKFISLFFIAFQNIILWIEYSFFFHSQQQQHYMMIFKWE